MTDFQRVERVVTVQTVTGMNGDRGVSATLREAEDGFFGDLIHETDASAAHDATFVIEADIFSDVDVLGLFDFGFLETRLAAAVLD